LVVYDSYFGNTEKVARAIGAAIAGWADIKVVRVGEIEMGKQTGLDLLIVGSPTRAFRPSPAVGEFLKSIPEGGLIGVNIVAFDTRIAEGDVNFMLRTMMKSFGYAAKPILDKLAEKGGKAVAAPEGFAVSGKEGPLKEGELDRAAAWAKRIAEAL
jgi:flavodoxin